MTTSVITYAVAIWGGALQTQASRRRVNPVYRLSALKVASAFRTVSEDAACVIAGMLPIGLLAEERRSLYQRKGVTTLNLEDRRTEERRSSIRR